jgi:hypothetical protein
VHGGLPLTQGIYKSFLTPRFVLRKLLSVRSWDDVKFIWRGVKYVVGHLLDFSTRQARKKQAVAG